MSITADQVKSARMTLGWSRVHLSAMSSVPLLAIGKFEDGIEKMAEAPLTRLRWALLKAGIEFISEDDNLTVKLRQMHS